MTDGLNALLGIVPTIIVAGLVLKTFDLLTDAKKEQRKLRKKGVRTKLVKERGKYKLRKIV
jgi:hypothetical protein